NSELWVSHLVNPLIEEPIHGLAGGLFDSNSKLFSLDRLVSIFRQIMIYRAPPVFFAQHLAKHVQDGAAPRIRVGIEYRIRISIVLRHNRASIPQAPGAIILVLISLHIHIEKIVTAKAVFVPHSRKVGRET